MTKVVGVRFRNVGKIYYFSPKDYEIKTGDHVIVETARGIEYGKVVLLLSFYFSLIVRNSNSNARSKLTFAFRRTFVF